MAQPLAPRVMGLLSKAASTLGTCPPLDMQPLIMKTFTQPPGDPSYALNKLTPGGPGFEASYSELRPGQLTFNLQPLGPEASGIDRRDEATREMRRLVGSWFGREALRWFDERSEPWRGFGGGANLNFGAFFGTSHDRDGLYSSKVYYESGPTQIDGLPAELFGV